MLIIHFVDLVDMHAFEFVIRDFETTCTVHFDALLDFSFYGSHIFEAVTNKEIIDIMIRLFLERDRLLFYQF